jgi:hypothetical protein
MAKFNDVFSVTAKVVLSLMVISLLIGVAFYALGGVGSIIQKPRPDAAQDMADEARSSMPQTKWDKGIAKAIKVHCITDGMSKEEVLRSYGEPTKKTDYTYNNGLKGSEWVWELPPGDCLKYAGENCVERETRQKMIMFTAKGNVFKVGYDCVSIDDHYYRSQELFGSGTVETVAPTSKSKVRQSQSDDLTANENSMRSCAQEQNSKGTVSTRHKRECDAAADWLSDHGYVCYVDGHCEKKPEYPQSRSLPDQIQ